MPLITLSVIQICNVWQILHFQKISGVCLNNLSTHAHLVADIESVKEALCTASGHLYRMISSSSTRLYRRLLRDARKFPVKPIGRKLAYNYREMFDLYREENDPQKIGKLLVDGEAAIRVLKWVRGLPQVVLIVIAATPEAKVLRKKTLSQFDA